MRKLFVFWIGFLMLIATNTASASIITFDSYTPLNNQSSDTIITDGFSFSEQAINPGVYSYNSSPAGAFNGTPYLIFGFGPLTFGQTNGDSFMLNSFDLGLSWYTTDVSGDPLSSALATITSNLVGGSTSLMDVTLTRSFQTFNIGLDDVTSVVISSDTLSIGYFAMDNVNVNEGSPVPEPATMVLFGFGLLGLSGVSRRKK